MKKEVVAKLKEMYAQRKLEFVVLFVLATIEDDKFISRQYINDILEVQRGDIMQTLSRLTREGLAESHYLLAYRMSQKEHDQYMVRTHFDTLNAQGLIPEGKQRYTLWENDFPAIRDNAPASLKREIGWFDDVATQGKKALMEFVEKETFGSLKLVGKSPIQSVYRITFEGKEKLNQYKQQYGIFNTSKTMTLPDEFIERVRSEFVGDEGWLATLQDILEEDNTVYRLGLLLEQHSGFDMNALEVLEAFNNGEAELVRKEAEKRVRIGQLYSELCELTKK